MNSIRSFLFITLAIGISGPLARAQTCQAHFTQSKTLSLIEADKAGQAVHPNLYRSDGWFLEKFNKEGKGQNKIIHVGRESYLSYDRPDEFQRILERLGLSFNPDLLIQVPEVPGSRFYPIRLSTLPDRFLKKIGLTTIYEGARCYSALFFALEYKDYITSAGPEESKLLLASDLFERISWEELREGDVIALGKGDYPTDHVAFLITDDLVFHKANEFEAEYISLVPRSHFRSSYNNYEDGVQFFRPRLSWQDFLEKHKDEIPKEALAGLRAIEVVAKKLEEYYLTGHIESWYDKPEAFYEDFQKQIDLADDIGKKWVAYAKAELEKPEVKNNPNLSLVLGLLREQADSMSSLEGPYD